MWCDGMYFPLSAAMPFGRQSQRCSTNSLFQIPVCVAELTKKCILTSSCYAPFKYCLHRWPNKLWIGHILCNSFFFLQKKKETTNKQTLHVHCSPSDNERCAWMLIMLWNAAADESQEEQIEQKPCLSASQCISRCDKSGAAESCMWIHDSTQRIDCMATPIHRRHSKINCVLLLYYLYAICHLSSRPQRVLVCERIFLA